MRQFLKCLLPSRTFESVSDKTEDSRLTAATGCCNDFISVSTDRVLPDFRFSGGFMTSDLDRLTRSDLRLTSRIKAEALSGSLIIGLCLVGVTQYSCVVVNILVVFNMLAFFVSFFRTRNGGDLWVYDTTKVITDLKSKGQFLSSRGTRRKKN